MGGLEIRRNVPAGGLIADRRLYLTRDKLRMVEDGDPDAGFLLCAPGRVIPAEDCAALGLQLVDGRIVQDAGEPESEPTPEPAEPTPEEEAPADEHAPRRRKKNGE